MTGRIRDEDVELVKAAARIEVVAADYVRLSNGGGGELKGLCPFHDEQSPSFYVSPGKGLFHCFGCHEAGDALGLVMKLENLGFTQAVEQLAVRFGIELRGPSDGDVSRARHLARLRQAVEMAAAFYQGELGGENGARARGFLRQFGIDRGTSEAFGLGYAPQGARCLMRHLTEHGFSETELESAGLCTRGDHALRDRLQDRLVWPVRDASGRLVGLAGAADTGGDGQPSTPGSSPLYRPALVLFGIDLARKSAAASGRVVVCSDYSDVLACHLAGARDSVGVCGGRLGAAHLSEVRRLLDGSHSPAPRVVFAAPLPAGAVSAVLSDTWVAARAAVASSPAGEGPWRVLGEQGADGVTALLERKVPFYAYAVQAALEPHDLTTLAGRLAGLDAACGTIARIKDGLLQHTYSSRLLEWLGGPEWLGGTDLPQVAARVRELAALPAPQEPGGSKHGAPSAAVSEPEAARPGRGMRQQSGPPRPTSGVRGYRRP
jgi:DNA primase